jgi:hypothetical protein
MTPFRAPFLVILAVLAGPAAAQTVQPAAANPSQTDKTAPLGSPQRPAEVTVIATPPVDPKVVSTFPSDGGKAPGGVVVLKIVFDQPMVPEAWSYGESPDGAFPHCLKKPRLLNDHRSFALLCSVAPDLDYAVQINASPDFVSARGRSAKPFLLRFSTTDQTVYDMGAALKQAGLTEADEPIMTWNAQPGGVADEPAPPRYP